MCLRALPKCFSNSGRLGATTTSLVYTVVCPVRIFFGRAPRVPRDASVEGGEGDSASWTVVLQVMGLQIRRFFIVQLVATDGIHRCYGLMCFEQAVYFPASWVLTAEQGLPASSRITLWETGDKVDHTEWLGLGGSSGEHQSSLLLKQAHPQQVAQVCVQVGFPQLQRRRLRAADGKRFLGDSSLWLQHGCLSCRFPPERCERCLPAEHKGLLVTNGCGTAAAGVVVVRT